MSIAKILMPVRGDGKGDNVLAAATAGADFLVMGAYSHSREHG